MTKASTAMEQQVERIKRLLEPQGAEVLWNEKIPDPDNPKQLRQIDVTIRRDGKLTHVECRVHQEPQDVSWIEELIGRRISLGADAVIAVSASGYTEGAILKANAKGIILRELSTLSEDEVRHWGKVTKARLVYFEFQDTLISLAVPPGKYNASLGLTKRDGSPAELRGLFELVMREAEGKPELDHSWHELSMKFNGADILVGGAVPIAGMIETGIRRVLRNASLASVVAYSAAGSPTPDTYARVQHYDAAFEIIDAGKGAAVVLDLSTVPTPKNCLFHGANFDFGRPVVFRWFQPIGITEAMDYDGVVTVRVVEPQTK
jgi:hypothetical protein